MHFENEETSSKLQTSLSHEDSVLGILFCTDPVVKTEPDMFNFPEELDRSFTRSDATTVEKHPGFHVMPPTCKTKIGTKQNNDILHPKESELPTSMFGSMQETNHPKGRSMFCLPNSMFSTSSNHNIFDYLPSFKSQATSPDSNTETECQRISISLGQNLIAEEAVSTQTSAAVTLDYLPQAPLRISENKPAKVSAYSNL
ncbi:hypothetical protein JCM33374_g862 [Metschnikowia sp. JCM 33374]|nr:hypothetical protein JCM33374_g862 [Metschnikowia sp. JCM 33374]